MIIIIAGAKKIKKKSIREKGLVVVMRKKQKKEDIRKTLGRGARGGLGRGFKKEKKTVFIFFRLPPTF